MATGGSENPKVKHKVIWGLPIGAISVAMTIAGGLTSLQTASVVTGLPFSIILLLMTLLLCARFAENIRSTSKCLILMMTKIIPFH